MPFKPGQSGNPDGDKKRKIITDALHLELCAAAGKGDKSKARKIAEKLIEAAMQGDVRAAELIFERTEGKVAQELNVNIEDAFSTFLTSLGTITPEVRSVEVKSQAVLN